MGDEVGSSGTTLNSMDDFPYQLPMLYFAAWISQPPPPLPSRPSLAFFLQVDILLRNTLDLFFIAEKFHTEDLLGVAIIDYESVRGVASRQREDTGNRLREVFLDNVE